MRVAIVLCLLVLPSLAYAYVDPGVLSALYQLMYIAIFGLITAVIFRPWAFLKTKISRFRNKKSPDERQLP
jgi:hypothetical protein